MMTILWWHWLALGLLLVALEMAASGGFYIIFFGVAAIAIALLRLVDLGGPVWVQLLLFSVSGRRIAAGLPHPAAALAAARSRRAPTSTRSSATSPCRSRTIAPGAVGRAELRGTVWSARNRAARALARGERCRVVSVDELMIFIEPEGAR